MVQQKLVVMVTNAKKRLVINQKEDEDVLKGHTAESTATET